MQVTRALARFVADCRQDSVPDAIRHQARRALLNVLGCAVGAACWSADELPDARSLTCHLSPPANGPAG